MRLCVSLESLQEDSQTSNPYQAFLDKHIPTKPSRLWAAAEVMLQRHQTRQLLRRHGQYRSNGTARNSSGEAPDEILEASQ